MSTQSAIPRLEIWDTLRCNSGTRLGFVAGDDNGPFLLNSVASLDGQEGVTFSIPSDCDAAAFVKEARVATIWRSDTDFDEFFIGRIVRRRDAGGKMEVSGTPPIYRLADAGLVPEWQVTNTTGVPLLDVGVSQLSVTTILQTYLVNNPFVSAVLPWLRVGAITPTVLIDLSWSFASPQAVVVGAVEAAQNVAGVPYDYRLIRNGTASYDITITAVS